MPMVKLQSSDGKIFETDIEIAKCSGTMKHMIEDLNIQDGGEPIPLPNVNSAILGKVLEWAAYHLNRPEPRESNGPPRIEDIIWEIQFFKVDLDTLVDLILAANYLEVKEMLDVGCRTIADMMRDKTPEEIRATFNITKDLTPEEEEEIVKEASYCEPR